MTIKNELRKAILTRRSVKDGYIDKPVTKEAVLSLLDDAVWAPTHGKREPWRFIFVGPEDKQTFARDIASTYPEHMQENREAYLNEPNAFLIAIMQAPENQKQWDENFGAIASLLHNLSLLAWTEGLGVCWKTNPHIYDEQVREKLQVADNEKIVGFVHLGYFDPAIYEAEAEERKRTNPREKLSTYPF